MSNLLSNLHLLFAASTTVTTTTTHTIMAKEKVGQKGQVKECIVQEAKEDQRVEARVATMMSE